MEQEETRAASMALVPARFYREVDWRLANVMAPPAHWNPWPPPEHELDEREAYWETMWGMR